jgi:hypothetical protein
MPFLSVRAKLQVGMCRLVVPPAHTNLQTLEVRVIIWRNITEIPGTNSLFSCNVRQKNRHEYQAVEKKTGDNFSRFPQ